MMTVYTGHHVFSEAFSVFRSMQDSRESISTLANERSGVGDLLDHRTSEGSIDLPFASSLEHNSSAKPRPEK